MKTKFIGKWLLTMSVLLMCVWTQGCAHYTVVAQDREVRRLTHQKMFEPPVDGWFVPDATWIDLNVALGNKLNGK